MNKLQEILSVYLKGDKLAQAVEEITPLLAPVKQVRVVNPDIVKDGITYKYCVWSRKYHNIEDFIGGVKKKNYCRKAHSVWNGFYKGAQKMQLEASNKLIAGKCTEEEFKQLIAEAQAYDARKGNPEEYAHIEGYTAEDLQ